MPVYLAPPVISPWRGLRPPAIGTQATYGVPFLDQVPAFVALWPNARLIVQMAFGATPLTDLTNPSVWTDVTRDVQYVDANTNAINIGSIGRPDAVTRAQPASCGFQLKNMTGKYSQGPQSENYPNIKLSIPTRVGITLSGASNTVLWRFWGSAWSMKPSFDKTGNYAIVIVQAGGKMRQMQQGRVPARSALTRAIVRSTAAPLRQFWSCEDKAGSTQAASAISTGTALNISGTPTLASFNPANVSSVSALNYPYGTGPLINFKSGGSATVTFAAGTASGWTVQIGAFADPFGAPTAVTLAEWLTPGGSYVRWQLISDSNIATNGTRVIGIDSNGIATTLVSSAFAGGAWNEYRIQASQSGADIALTLKFPLDTKNATLSTKTLAGITSMSLNPTGASYSIDVGIGQVRVWDGITAADFQVSSTPLTSGVNAAWFSYLNENAIDRLRRVCREEGIALDTTGASTATMGPQGVDVPLNILRECEAADLGILGDGRGSGLYYVSRAARYNQSVTVSLPVNGLADPLDPEGDDQRIRNKYTVTRKNGSSATFEQKTGVNGTNNIETYEATPDSGDINLASDATLSNIAAFLTGLGTVEGYRYPTIGIDWRRTEAAAQAAAWLTMAPGGRMQTTGVHGYVSQLPDDTLDLLAEGWSEQLSRFMWRVSPVNCSPASPWNVGTRGGPARIAAANSKTQGVVYPGDTTMTVIGHAFSTVTPYDINAGGWRVTVTNVSGSTFTINPAPGQIPTGSPVTAWNPVRVALA